MNISTSMNLNFIIPEAYLEPSRTPTMEHFCKKKLKTMSR